MQPESLFFCDYLSTASQSAANHILRPLCDYVYRKAKFLHPKNVKKKKNSPINLIFKLNSCSFQKNIVYLHPDNLKVK